MEEKARIRLSKFFSLVLRHRPEMLDLQLGDGGWVDVDTLLGACATSGRAVTREQLDEVVADCPKQRFAFSEDGSRIRANQGHSVEVDLGYESATPPAVLFHGTTTERLGAIRKQGLRRMKRHHVHLSADVETAQRVGARHGKVVVLQVDTERMQAEGHAFSRSTNGVWLTEHVPPQFLTET